MASFGAGGIVNPRIIFVFACLFLIAGVSEAQTYRVLYDFTGVNGDGALPIGQLILNNSTIYGTTSWGGNVGGVGGLSGNGTIFAYSLATGDERAVYAFNNSPDGSGPISLTILNGSTLIGTTGDGGTGGSQGFGGLGTIFTFGLASNAEKVVWSFTGSPSDSEYPNGLIQSTTNSNLFYGTGSEGGNQYTNGPPGTVFSYNAASGSMNIIHNFGAGEDGQYPGGTPVQSGSMLYGVTSEGGSSASAPSNTGTGTIYSINTTTGAESVIHSFLGGANDGTYPFGNLTVVGSTLYGITAHGGADNDGTLYSYNVTTNTFDVLHTFTVAGPYFSVYGSLIQSGSLLYGMARYDGAYDDGSIFSFNTATNTYTTLFSFNDADGQYPYGSLYLSGTTLYGTTNYGGTDSDGVLFSLTVPEPKSYGLLVIATALLLTRRMRDQAVPGASRPNLLDSEDVAPQAAND